MPKVSEQHREDRRRQILDAAWTCFARNGFHKTSMPDVFAESGLSSGAVYSYFPSKEALITAIAEVSTQQLVTALSDRIEQEELPPFPHLLPRVLEDLAALGWGTTPAPMALQVWSEMMRDPQLAVTVGTMLGEVHERFTRVCRLYQVRGDLAADMDPADVGRVMITLLQGGIAQWNLLGMAAHLQLQSGLEQLSRHLDTGGGLG
jgi:AcrR family transcriptional regulator